MTRNANRQLNNDADAELLSAFLDNQLSAAERLTLERRLAREPELRAELDELRATVALVRDLPTLRPPRSFTLDPAALPPRRWNLFPALRLTTMVTAVLLALTLTPDLAMLLSGGMAPATRNSAPAMHSAPQATGLPESLSYTADPPAAAELAPAPTATAAPTMGLVEPDLALAPTSSAAMTGSAAESAAELTPAPTPPPATTTDAGEVYKAPDLSSEAEGAGVATPMPDARIEDLPSTIAQGPSVANTTNQAPPPAASESSSPGTRALEPPPPVTGPTIAWWRWVQLGLLATVVTLATATFWARRQQL